MFGYTRQCNCLKSNPVAFSDGVYCVDCGGTAKLPAPNQCRRCERTRAETPLGFLTCLVCDRSEVQTTYPSARKSSKEENREWAWRAARGLK